MIIKKTNLKLLECMARILSTVKAIAIKSENISSADLNF